MPELTDAQKVNREVTQKRIATALETLAQNSEAPIGLGMTGATGGQVPVVKTVDENGVPTSYEPGAGGGGQEIEVSDTEPTNPSVDVWFQEQQQGTPVEVYTVPEINDMIAPAETSPTQAAHHVGEYIICVINGQAKLYKVIAEISPGETLTVGGNIQSAAVMDTVNSGEISVPFDGSDMALIIRRTGKVVSVRFPGFSNINLAAWSAHQLATIPEGYRPSINLRFIYPRQNATDTIPVFVTVYNYGNISVENQSGVARDSGVCMATSFTWAIN